MDAEVNAGRTDIEVADVRSADLNVAAGKLVAELTGAAPTEIDLEVNAGSLELTVPDVEYAVSDDVSAGNFENRVRTSPRSDNLITATVSAGDAVGGPLVRGGADLHGRFRVDQVLQTGLQHPPEHVLVGEAGIGEEFTDQERQGRLVVGHRGTALYAS